MEIQRVNQTDPERVFMSFKNSYSTASFTAGQWGAHDVTADQDGVSVTKPAARDLSMIAGVANHTIAHGSYGLFQVWGYRADARCQGGDTLGVSKISSGTALHFLTSSFAAQAMALTSATVVSSFTARRACGFGLAPTNTAALTTQESTSGQFKVMITCL